MLQANRMKLGECKSRETFELKSLPNWQGVLANSQPCGGAPAAEPQIKKLRKLFPPRMKMMALLKLITGLATLRQTANDLRCSKLYDPTSAPSAEFWCSKECHQPVQSQNKLANFCQATLTVRCSDHPKALVKQLLCPRLRSWSQLRKPGQQANDSPEWTWGGTPNSFRRAQCGTK